MSVDGDDGGDSYSPLGDFELKLKGGDDKNGDDDGNDAGDRDRHNCEGQQTGQTEDPANRQAGRLRRKQTGRRVLNRRRCWPTCRGLVRS